jgi:hypothetical protein
VLSNLLALLRDSIIHLNCYFTFPELPHLTPAATLIQNPTPQVTHGQSRALKGHMSKHNKTVDKNLRTIDWRREYCVLIEHRRYSLFSLIRNTDF